MAKYLILADVVDGEVQNVQEWATTWGELETEIENVGGEILDAYAMLGGADFLFVVDVDDEEAAIQTAIAIERHGLDTTTHQLVDVERLGELVDDV